MSKDKTIQLAISEDCWIELGIIKLRKRKANVQEVIREILEAYTNKIISKNNNNDTTT